MVITLAEIEQQAKREKRLRESGIPPQYKCNQCGNLFYDCSSGLQAQINGCPCCNSRDIIET